MLPTAEQEDAAFSSVVAEVKAYSSKLQECIGGLQALSASLTAAHCASVDGVHKSDRSSSTAGHVESTDRMSDENNPGEITNSNGQISGSGNSGGSENDAQASKLGSRKEFNEIASTLLMGVVNLRYLHRQMHIAGHGAKRYLEPLRKEVEACRLDLENLSYEREMLRREVTLLKSYEAVELSSIGLAPTQKVESWLRKRTAQNVNPSLQEPAIPSLAGNPVAHFPEDGLTQVGGHGSREGAHSVQPVEAHSATNDSNVDTEVLSKQNGQSQTGNVNNDTMRERGELSGDYSLADFNRISAQAPSTDESSSVEHEHRLMLHKLDYELEERKRLGLLVDDVRRERQRRELEVETESKFLHLLPERIKQVLDAVGPLRKFFLDDTGIDAARNRSHLLPKDEASVLRDLPQPLYVLAREAISYRDTYNGTLAVYVLERDPRNPEAEPALAVPSKPPLIVDSSRISSLSHAADVQSLPVLKRDHASQRARFGDNLELTPSPGNDFARQSSFEERAADTLRSLHNPHSKLIQIDILDPHDGNGSSDFNEHSPIAKPAGDAISPNSTLSHTDREHIVLRLIFQLIPKLGIVTVSCLNYNDRSQVTTDDLCMLYPSDYGDKSPNATNSQFVDGQFRFERELIPYKGRPYLWANLLCGLHFPGCIRESMDSACHLPDEFQRWCDVAATYPTHLRFKDVIAAVRRRVRALQSLREQLVSLSNSTVPLSPRQIGLRRRPKSSLKMFVQCPPEMSRAGLELAAGSKENYTAVWAFQAEHPDGITVAGMVGIQPDYPVSAGLFRMKCTSSIMVSEADIREMELEVNAFGNSFTLRSDRAATEKESYTSRVNALANGSMEVYRADAAEEIRSVNERGVHERLVPAGPDQCHSDAHQYPRNEHTSHIEKSSLRVDMILSMQVLKLLYCMDVVADAIGQHASFAGSEERTSWVGSNRSGEGNDSERYAGMHDIEEGEADDVSDMNTVCHSRLTRGRSRSKSYTF